jgi:AraC-like DNA-binding protein
MTGALDHGPGWALLGLRAAGPFRVSLKQYAPDFRQGVHAHGVGTIDFNLAGGGSGTYSGRAMESTPGAVEFYAPGREHSFACGPRGIRTMHVAFDPSALGGRRVESIDVRSTVDQARAVGAAARLLRELHDADAPTPAAVESLGYELLAVATAWRDRPGRGPAWVSRVRAALDEGAGPDLGSLAAREGVHRGHLARSFSARYGVSIGEYHRGRRIHGAAERLALGVESLAEAAQSSGFADQAHLTRWFVRVLGVTPGVYARLLRRERDALRRGRPGV